MVDRAEDRYKFSGMIDSLGLQQPPWKELRSMEDAQVQHIPLYAYERIVGSAAI
jgi:hypothetical protein